MGASPYRPVGYTPSEGASGFVLGEKSILILFGDGLRPREKDAQTCMRTGIREVPVAERGTFHYPPAFRFLERLRLFMMNRHDKAGAASVKVALSASTTEAAFDRRYWYAVELREFAVELGIPSASKLRKDQMETAIRQVLRTGETTSTATPKLVRRGPRDVDRGLKLNHAVVHYTSNKDTKLFIEREAAKIEPGFKRASGTCYLLNQWREEQIAAGRKITYRDLVLQAIALNKSKSGPLRVESGRYINFISDFMADNKGASHGAAVKAWHEVKAMNVPKTYVAWARVARKRTPPTRPTRSLRLRF